MKTNALLAFFFFFVTALFAAFTAAEIVYDSHGDILHNRGNYYFVSPGYGGSSIDIADVGNGDDSCSIAVVHKLLYNQGRLINIATPHPTIHITTEYPLWLSFAKFLGSCTLNRQWLVTRNSKGHGDFVMMADDKEANFLSGWFYIKPYDAAQFHYKLVFCSEQDKCGHVGSKTDSHGNHRLIVTDDESVKPLVFKFVKEISDISMVV